MSESDSSKLVVLAAVDLNPGSTLVMKRAVELAATHRAGEVHVLTVVEPELPLGVYPGVVASELEPPAAQRTVDFCQQMLRDITAHRTLEHVPSITVHAVVGWAQHEIVWLAAHLNADYIVMATHGRRGFRRLLIGSVAEKVVRLAGCPVIVVREKDHNAEWRIPEIEPVCPACAERRANTEGAELWCARHSERHVRSHVNHYAPRGKRHRT
ncbi:MAG: universal stress protein, partial [Polyangiaceae bacterium]|nr:universal stress protein [Polyangiaceae bacterium]